MNEVKRQAVVELQKAVAAAEVKARELVATERGKMENLIVEARRQAVEEALSTVNQQSDSNEVGFKFSYLDKRAANVWFRS